MAKEKKKALVPKLRFPKFRGSAEWKAKRMDSLYSFMRNNTLSRDKLNYAAGTAKNIHYGDIHTKFSTLFDITKERVPFINVTEELPDADADDYCVVGDLIFADSSEDTNDVGKCIEIVRLDKQHLLAGQHTILARQRNGEFVIGFGGRVFQSARVRSQIQHEAQGTKVYAISPTRLARIEVAYPSDKDEQQKIADCLSSLDELIAAQGRKVEALKAYKRGLMQQLFPRECETLPRLRFPEFRDAPEWKSEALGKFIDEFREKSKTQDQYEVLTSARSGLVRQRDYYDNDAITERDNVGFNVVPPNYVTYRSRSDDRRFYFNENKLGITGIISTYYPVFRILGGSNKFFVELLSQHAELVGRRSVGTSQTVLSLNELRRIELPTPSATEQQQIANTLASLDSEIVAETEKFDALKAHKTGLMQQLFPSLEEA